MWRLRFLLALALLAPGWNAPKAEEPSHFGITPVIQQIKREIRAAQEEQFEIGLLLGIEKVTLTMQLVEATRAEAEFGPKFAVAGAKLELGGGGSTVESTGRTVTLEMKPSSELLVGGAKTFGLAEAIREVKEAIRAALKTEPQFTLEKFVFDFAFEIEHSADGTMKFVVFEAGGTRQRASTHHISVVFREARL